jgi:hypothetical protein
VSRDFLDYHGFTVAVTGAIVSLVLLFALLLIPKDITVTVTGRSWERSVRIEAYRLVQEEDWSMPPEATFVSSRMKQSGTRRSLSHYRSVEDCTGYGEKRKCTSRSEPVYRDEPIYDRAYTYNIWRWIFARQPSNSGTDRDPKYPDFTLAADERENGRFEKYLICLIDFW